MRFVYDCQWIHVLVRLGATCLLIDTVLGLPRLQAQGQLGPAEQRPAEHENGLLSKQSEEWGPANGDLRTRLLPSQKDFVLGQPAKFRLEMKNFGNRRRTYDPQRVAANNSITIDGPDGKPVRYVAGGVQTGGSPKSISPGETVILFDDLDLLTQYLIVKPGRYTLQFRGTNVIWRSESEIPPSNKLAIEMRPGTLPAAVQVPARLIEILPEHWGLSLNGGVSEVNDGKISPPGWESGRATYISLATNPVKSNLKRDVLRVQIWVAEQRLSPIGSVQAGRQTNGGEAAIYLGKGIDGHVYWTVSVRAEKDWPDIQAKVMNALQIVPAVMEPGTRN